MASFQQSCGRELTFAPVAPAPFWVLRPVLGALPGGAVREGLAGGARRQQRLLVFRERPACRGIGLCWRPDNRLLLGVMAP